MRAAISAFTTSHEELRTKRLRHDDTDIGGLMEYGYEDPRDGMTARAHLIRYDEGVRGTEHEAQVNEDCIKREASGKYYAKIYVSRRGNREPFHSRANRSEGWGPDWRLTDMGRPAATIRHEHDSGASGWQSVGGGGMSGIHDVRMHPS